MTPCQSLQVSAPLFISCIVILTEGNRRNRTRIMSSPDSSRICAPSVKISRAVSRRTSSERPRWCSTSCKGFHIHHEVTHMILEAAESLSFRVDTRSVIASFSSFEFGASRRKADHRQVRSRARAIRLSAYYFFKAPGTWCAVVVAVAAQRWPQPVNMFR